MKILLVKLSSMGDIFHTYPAISDLQRQFPEAELTWLVDTSFKKIAGWHPFVKHLIDVPLRKIKKEGRGTNQKELTAALESISENDYDYVIDAQGLLKSAWLARKANGSRHGYGWSSAREPIASLFYRHKHRITKDAHAVDRTRQLFASALGYDSQSLKFHGLTVHQWPQLNASSADYGLIFPGTTWATKHWVPDYWFQFCEQVSSDMTIWVGWGSPDEQEFATELTRRFEHVNTFDHWLSLEDMAAWIAHAKWVVGVDTGFVHLASAMERPTVGIYGPTDPAKCGVLGPNNINANVSLACMPCHKKRCTNPGPAGRPKCMEQLTSQQIVTHLRSIEA